MSGISQSGVSRGTGTEYARDASGNITGLVGYVDPKPNTVYLAGDSFTANSLIITGSNFINRASEGWFNWFDAFLGAPFSVMGKTAAGGETCRTMIDSQFPTIFALSTKPRFVSFTAGLNDIYTDTQSAATTYARIVEAVRALIAQGITPIWGTIFAKAYDSVATPKAMQCNDMLRLFAQQNNCGIFIDFASIMSDPTSANNEGRTPLASYYYDSATHPNNLFAMRIGQWAAAQVSARFPQFNLFSVGNENVTFSGGSSNLLLEPSFIATAGTAGSNVTGTVPTSWTVDWATRTGTPTCAAAIVSLTDATTGLQIANGIELTVGGSAASGDVLRVTQTNSDNSGLTSNLSVGSVIQGEGIFKVASGANISEIAMRVQTGTNESTWNGVNAQTAVALPATIPACARRTYPLTVLAVSAARFDWRIKFNGAGTGSVITVWRPRFRKVS